VATVATASPTELAELSRTTGDAELFRREAIKAVRRRAAGATVWTIKPSAATATPLLVPLRPP
jgi:hypothetical protein